MSRPRRNVIAAIVLPVLAVALSGCDIAMAEFKEKATAEWRRQYDLQPGGRLTVSNINGKIDVQASTDRRIEIVAEKIAKAGSQEAARQALGRIDIRESASPTDVRVETKLQRGEGLFGGGGLEVHYAVRVPPDVEVKVSTVNGGIELTNLSGRLNAEATNGGIKARDVSGSLQASTTNGGIDVEITDVADPGLKLECTNGGIKLRLPGTTKATISARITNGGIRTDGLQLESTGDASQRRLDGRLNGGGPRIQLEGTNGGIVIAAR